MPDASTDWINEIYADLEVLREAAFPKTCATCGTTYHNMDEFLSQTTPPSHSTGLSEVTVIDDVTVVGLFRNCGCGSTLMQGAKDRRDNSSQGNQQREKFSHMLDLLEAHGLTRIVARTEVLKIMNGQESDLLRTLGIDMDRVLHGTNK